MCFRLLAFHAYIQYNGLNHEILHCMFISIQKVVIHDCPKGTRKIYCHDVFLKSNEDQIYWDEKMVNPPIMKAQLHIMLLQQRMDLMYS